MKITFASLLLVLFQKATNQQCLSDNDTTPENSNGFDALYTGQQEFSLVLFQAVNQLMPKENVVLSPFSTYQALLIAYFLAGGRTENELKSILRLDPSQTKPSLYFGYLLNRLDTRLDRFNGLYEFTSVSKIYFSDQIDVRDCIYSVFDEEFSATPLQSDPESARVAINKWVEEHTQNMIKDLLPPGSIHQRNSLVLANAAYFKGMWERQFNPQETKRKMFYVNPSKLIMVDMMHVKGSFNHSVSESLGIHVLEMPYKGDKVSMYVFLPPFTKESAIDNMLKKLTVDTFENIVNSTRLTTKQVVVSFPKFSLELSIELAPILESLGVGDLFKGEANFTRFSNNKDFSVEGPIHKTRIDINEQGATADAATVMFSDWVWMDDERNGSHIKFNCNRPFVFMIFNKERHHLLFTGVYRTPA